MKVDRTRNTGQLKAGRKASSAGEAVGTFKPAAADAVDSPKMISGPAPLAAVDALLAIQEAPGGVDPRSRRRRAVRRGEDMLDLLEEIKLGLLVGRLPSGKLQALLAVVGQQRDQVSDPKLAAVLDQIELRAQVELAKFSVRS